MTNTFNVLVPCGIGCPCENTPDGSNTQYYTLQSYGTAPVTLDEMKVYLNIPAANTLFDAVITDLIETCTQWGESYTGMDFRLNTWKLQQDCFQLGIGVRRKTVVIDSVVVTYLDESDQPIIVDEAIYYTVNQQQHSMIILNPNQDWPIDTSERQQIITVDFDSDLETRYSERVLTAIKRHVAYMFENRGDCGDCGACAGNDQSGAAGIYNQFRIVRI